MFSLYEATARQPGANLGPVVSQCVGCRGCIMVLASDFVPTTPLPFLFPFSFPLRSNLYYRDVLLFILVSCL